MGIITRHVNAPFADGETLTGADLEHDFATIYDAFNGSINSANIADLAVTTPKMVDLSVTTAKLAANAVTQAKMTSGAASTTEVQVDTGSHSMTTALTAVGSGMVHTVGDPARHVIILVSLRLAIVAGKLVTFQMYKDAVDMFPGTMDAVQSDADAGTGAYMFTRMYIDSSPTAGGSHTYQLKAAADAAYSRYNLAMLVFEPRS